jgi:hypothetical protein
VRGEDGKPVELGRGAMGVTYKAFDTLESLALFSRKKQRSHLDPVLHPPVAGRRCY